MARYARIVSTGRFVPPIEVPNAALKARWPQFPDFVDKMEASSGIRTPLATRRRTGPPPTWRCPRRSRRSSGPA